MRIQWKPDKARGAKREQKQRLERQQKRKTFTVNMERTETLVTDYHNDTNITATYTGDLEPKFVDWALSKYRHDKFKENDITVRVVCNSLCEDCRVILEEEDSIPVNQVPVCPQ
jgi:serine protease inhibitor ecotin